MLLLVQNCRSHRRWHSKMKQNQSYKFIDLLVLYIKHTNFSKI